MGYRSIVTDKTWSSLSSGWHKFELSFDGQYAMCWVDGVFLKSSAKFSSGKIGYNTSNSIFVGAEAGSSSTSPNGSYFKGKVRNVKILNISNAKSASYKNSYGDLPTPTRTNYSFGGWYTSATGGTKITSTSICTRNYDHTLYAHWNANVVKINLNANGGSGGATAIWFKYGTNTMYSNSACTSSISSISLPSRTGYTFNNYYCASATQGANTNESYIYSGGNWGADLCTDFYSEATLTASWTIKSYTLSVINGDDGIDDITNPATAWNIGGGRYVAGGGKSISVNYNQTVTIAVAVKQGYTFSRWSDGNTSMSRTVTIGTSNATYYAYTTPNTYSITFDGNGGEIAGNGYRMDAEKTYSGSNYDNLGRTYMYTDKLYLSIEAYMSNWSDYAADNQRIISCTEGGGWNIESTKNAQQYRICNL